MTTLARIAHHRIALAGAIALGAAAAPALADFNYADFSSITGLTLVGAATQNSNRILVTPSVGSSAGAVWAAQKQNVSAGFDATMTLHVEDKHGLGADGITMVIQNASPTALGAVGGGIGYGQNPTYGLAGIPNSIAIVLDMWDNNPQWAEPGNNHVTIQSRGLLQNSPLGVYSLANAPTADLSDGARHTMRVNYTAGLLSVYLDGNLTPAVQTAVNLSTLLSLGGDGGEAWIGVTAATGAIPDREAHVLDSFAFHSCPIPTPGTASLLLLGGVIGIRRKR